jgi:hypothetical protein
MSYISAEDRRCCDRALVGGADHNRLCKRPNTVVGEKIQITLKMPQGET